MDDEKVSADVNKTIKSFHQSIDPNFKSGAFENIVFVNFYQKPKSGKSGNIWSSETNREPWERWSIKVNVHFAENEKESRKFKILAEKQLRACLLYISSINMTEMYHVPALRDENISHSYKISLQNTHNSDSWTTLLKKMISDSAIPSILK